MLKNPVFAFVDMDPPVQLTSLTTLASFETIFLRILICFPRGEGIAVTEFGLVKAPKMNVNLINQ